MLSIYFAQDVESLSTLNFQAIQSFGSGSDEMSFAYVVGQVWLGTEQPFDTFYSFV